MPKQLLKIDQFHGGLNNNADPRDIAPNELSSATDVMVDELGKIRTLGQTATHGEAPANGAVITAGYGLFQFSHDRTGGHLVDTDLFGTHTGGDSDTVLIDSGAAFTSVLVGATVNNTTDGSSGTVASVDSGTQLTLDDLTGGSDNSWDDAANDKYTITNFPETGDDYLVMADADDAADIDIYSRVADVWSTSKIDLGAITGMKPCFYAVDGALRVSDGNFNNTNKWYGYVKRTHFSGVAPGGKADDYDGWFSKDQEIAAPTRGLFGAYLSAACVNDSNASTTNLRSSNATAFSQMTDELDGTGHIAVNDTDDQASIITARSDGDDLTCIVLASSATWQNDAYIIFPPAGAGFNVNIESNSGTAGTWEADDYEIATTFIYDGTQESLLFENAGNGVRNPIAANNSIDVQVFCTSPFNPRITGGRVYIRKSADSYGAGIDSGEPWSLLVEVSLKEGVRPGMEGGYNGWVLETAVGNGAAIDTVYLRSSTSTVSDKNPLTYDILNGWSQEENSLYAIYNTAVVANRMTYIANIKATNEDGQTVVMGDAMIKSPVNKFDTFPFSRRIEASVNDGDEIVKLEEYADRILQFKKNKMHLINISQELEFLEDTFVHKGISHPAGACKTDYGIAWVNIHGVYLYDGKEVRNLLERKGMQIINEVEWDKFLRADKTITGTRLTPMIGYLPKKRQLIVFDDVTTGGDGSPSMYLYDMVTQSWVQGANDSARLIDILKTNFVTDWNGDLVYAHTSDTGTVVKWDDTSDGTDTIAFKTKDIDFGNPAQKKTVYRVRISYKGDGSAVTVKYGTNGETDASDLRDFEGTDAYGNPDGSTDTTPLLDRSSAENLETWHHAELKPDTPSEGSNIYSFQLVFDGTAGANFEINDISIVYRLKGIR